MPIQFHRPSFLIAPAGTPEEELTAVQKFFRKPKDALTGDDLARYNRQKAAERNARSRVIDNLVTRGPRQANIQAASQRDALLLAPPEGEDLPASNADKPAGAHQAFAGDPAAPVETSAMPAADSTLHLALADNPRLPIDDYERWRELSMDSDAGVRAAAGRSLAAQTHGNGGLRRNAMAMASGSGTAAEVMMALAEEAHMSVRHALAGNVNAPDEVRASLARDREAIVRGAVARNPRTGGAALKSLAADANPHVRGAVAGNSGTPAALLTDLSNDPEASVREHVARNSNTPFDVLRRLAYDADANVRRHVPSVLRYCYALSKHTSLSAETLDKIERDWESSGQTDDSQLVRLTHQRINEDSGDFNRAVNPFIDKMLDDQPVGFDGRAIAELAGASRSTLRPSGLIGSALLARFAENHSKIPDATYGMEYEMFIPGVKDRSPRELNLLRLTLQATMYGFEEDSSLAVETNIALSLEMITSVMRSPRDIGKLQAVLSILNDFGAFSNDTSGVHAHIGVKQWNTGHLFQNPEQRPAGIRLDAWDAVPGQDEPSALQLLFMKQIAVDMAYIEEEYYKVSRDSSYSRRNVGGSFAEFAKNVSGAKTMEQLISAVQDEDRHRNVNLFAFEDHGTIEVRGFSKDGGDSMLVDPNMPIRDIVLMQDLQIMALASMRQILQSSVAPGDTLSLEPSAGLDELVHRYVQDTLWYQCVHAIGQREPGLRLDSMHALMKKKDHFTTETLNKIELSRGELLRMDERADHFIACLRGRAEWDFSDQQKAPRVVRRKSLRAAVSHEAAERGQDPGSTQ